MFVALDATDTIAALARRAVLSGMPGIPRIKASAPLSFASRKAGRLARTARAVNAHVSCAWGGSGGGSPRHAVLARAGEASTLA